MPQKIKGTFTSVWEEGVVNTHCELDPDTGELFPESVDVGDLGSLEREFFQASDDEDETPVCSVCHGFILKAVMNPQGRHNLVEGLECSDPDCESHYEE